LSFLFVVTEFDVLFDDLLAVSDLVGELTLELLAAAFLFLK
jgi:hypothetical protein